MNSKYIGYDMERRKMKEVFVKYLHLCTTLIWFILQTALLCCSSYQCSPAPGELDGTSSPDVPYICFCLCFFTDALGSGVELNEDNPDSPDGFFLPFSVLCLLFFSSSPPPVDQGQ